MKKRANGLQSKHIVGGLVALGSLLVAILFPAFKR